MQLEIDNWDGENIKVLPFVSKENSLGHKIEKAVRPLLQDWVTSRKEQQELQQKIDLETKKRPNWNQLNENEKNIKIIKQRSADKVWINLNNQLYDIQKQITGQVKEISGNAGQTKKPIQDNLITPIYNKYGGKAYSSKQWAKSRLTIDGKKKYYKYQKKNKPNIYIKSKPDVIKNIQKEQNIKNLKELIDYLGQQPKDTNTYSNEEIKEIILYVKMLILSRVSTQKNKYKNITDVQAEQLSDKIREKLNPTKQSYTFAQMVETITNAYTTCDNTMNNRSASKLNNNNNQIQPANNANNQVENQQANNQVENQQANNANNHAEQIDLDDNIPLEDALVEEIENKNEFADAFHAIFELNHNQEHNINGNNENVSPTNTINNNTDDINNTHTIFDQDIYIKKP